jgi:hypothetical protein
MDHKPRERETLLSERDWERLRQWSAGYDVGFYGEKCRIQSSDFFDRGAWVAGYARGQRDRRQLDETTR